MANLCLENAKFLNEKTLSESELIMNEFANINKMIQSICEFEIIKEEFDPNWKTEMKSSLKTFTKKFGLKLEELKHTIMEKIKMIIAKIRMSIIDAISKAAKNNKKMKIYDKEEKIEVFENSFVSTGSSNANNIPISMYFGLGVDMFSFDNEVIKRIYQNMISNIENNTRNKTYSSGIEIANDLYESKTSKISDDKLIKDENTTPDEAIKELILGDKKKEIKVVYTNSKKDISTSVTDWINKKKELIHVFECNMNKLRGSTISKSFDEICPKNEKEYNEECFRIAIQDMVNVIRTMFNIVNATSKYFYELIESEARVYMKAATNGYEYVAISKID